MTKATTSQVAIPLSCYLLTLLLSGCDHKPRDLGPPFIGASYVHEVRFPCFATEAPVHCKVKEKLEVEVVCEGSDLTFSNSTARLVKIRDDGSEVGCGGSLTKIKRFGRKTRLSAMIVGGLKQPGIYRLKIQTARAEPIVDFLVIAENE